VVHPDGRTEYLDAEPGLPWVSTPGSTLVLFTDGLVEHPSHSIDYGLDRLAELAGARPGLPLEDLVRTLIDNHPGEGHDDMAVLAVRTPSPGAGPDRVG
jgi:serine phosphatase RsbU (regulator of sigma subunit)